MLDIRKDMIKSLDVPPQPSGLETSLCHCLVPKEINSFVDNSEKLSVWLKKCIRSLSYDVNDTCLIISGPTSVNKNLFFENLLPDEFKEYYINAVIPKEFVYDYFIVDLDGIEDRKYCKEAGVWCTEDNFVVRHPYTDKLSADKRAANYCGTVGNFNKHITRKDMPVIEISDINYELFNSINKLELWIELYNKYKLIR